MYVKEVETKMTKLSERLVDKRSGVCERMLLHKENVENVFRAYYDVINDF